MKFSGSKSVTFQVGPMVPIESLSEGEKNQRKNDEKFKSNGTQTTGDACFDGLSGSFMQVRNDFSSPLEEINPDIQYFEDKPEWNKERRKLVKRFRYVVCFLTLFGVSASLMARIILNVSVVEMTKGSQHGHHTTDTPPTESPLTSPPPATTTTITPDILGDDSSFGLANSSNGPSASEIGMEIVNDAGDCATDDECSGPKYDWSVQDQNVLLSSFYIGYAPSMLFSGGIADRYGSRIPLLVCVFATSAITILTPLVAGYSFTLLVGLRVLLGLLQGGLIPSVYDLFNKWLTFTEMSIFVPVIKLSFALGSFLGTSMPGIVVLFGFTWPHTFYAGGLICSIISILMLFLLTSSPASNPFVEPSELQWIMRKKPSAQMTKNITSVQANQSAICDTNTGDQSRQKAESIPWLLILTSPSVIALTLVKFTYNVGIDFMMLEAAVYLRQIHQASIETISVITSGSCLMQMALITFVGWAAKVLVNRRAFGLGRTKWRKIFQGAANFGMAASYFVFISIGPDQTWLFAGMMAFCFFAWMWGAGGESMVPYDLSSRYPATIMGVAHSISILSGLFVPLLCGITFGEESDNIESWNLVFMTIGSMLTVGGLVFAVVLKAKPFLPGEKETPQIKVDPIH